MIKYIMIASVNTLGYEVQGLIADLEAMAV